MTSYSHLSIRDESLRQIVERALCGLREYPSGPATRERRYLILYALNDLSDRLMADGVFKSRAGQQMVRSAAIINDPCVELITDGSGGEREELGVLYQFALDGGSVRFGLRFYADEELEVSEASEKAANWRVRLSSLLFELEAEGFTLAPDAFAALQVDEDRWDIGWLAWRGYVRGAIPDDDALLRDFRRVLEAYHSINA